MWIGCSISPDLEIVGCADSERASAETLADRIAETSGHDARRFQRLPRAA